MFARCGVDTDPGVFADRWRERYPPSMHHAAGTTSDLSVTSTTELASLLGC